MTLKQSALKQSQAGDCLVNPSDTATTHDQMKGETDMMTYEESLTWNQDGYNEAISRRNPEYRISIEEFREWLTNNNEWAGFTASMNNPFNNLVDRL